MRANAIGLAVGLSGCLVGADYETDLDQDGVVASEDCDDGDPSLGAAADDSDCDGVLTADDCDDRDSTSTLVADDADCDGVLAADDCDDGDPTSSVTAEDGDCDGVLATDDCDDGDENSTVVVDDGDCDGTLSADDCDDGDENSTSVADDADCDGILTEDDCDDGDANSTVVAEDRDCDGVLTADDCDDGDASLLGVADEATAVTLSGMGFVSICGHSFDMGCTPGQSGCLGNESPVMPVTLTHAYYIGETEVTQGQYLTVMGSNPSDFTACGSTCPVEQVSWHMAADFANAVSSAAGLTECYTCSGSGTSTSCSVTLSPYACDGYRLPTEAEWEAAARCGEDLLYAGANTAGDVAWYSGNSDSTTHAVAGKDPNSCGLYDMSGNVWEWTQDWYDNGYYTNSGRTDPEGPSSASNRVYRGGGWSFAASRLRASIRYGNGPSYRSNFLGFRLARTVP